MATTSARKRGIMAQVLSRMSASETLISDRHAESMLVGLLSEADKVTDPSAAAEEVRVELISSWGFDDALEGPAKPFVYQDGVAVIPVHGILLNRFNWCFGYVTGYDFIRRQMNLADADPDVTLIVFDHDSPGGEAAGCDELAREIHVLETPTMALVNSLSCSGGYWLAAPCNRIVAAPSSSVGSIGVYIQHWNIGKMLAEWGMETEFVKNGDFKTAGNMYEPLSDEARAYMQGMVDERAGEFHRAVAEFRGIEESVVKGTQARVMRPTEALSLGLIDAAESPTTAVASFVAEMGNQEPRTDDSQEEVEMAEISSEDRATIANEAKARIKGIMTSENAKGREGLAEHLAYSTDNTVEQADAIMAASPKAEAAKEEPEGDDAGDDAGEDKGDKPEDKGQEGNDSDGDDKASKPSLFEQSMDNGKHPNVGPDGQQSQSDGPAAGDKVAQILGAQAAATGRKLEKA